MKRNIRNLVIAVVAIPILLYAACKITFRLAGVPSSAPYEYMTLQEVGIAALLYIRDEKHPPLSIGDLYSAGYLVEKDEYRVGLPGGYPGGFKNFASKTHFSFPRSPDECFIKEGRLIDKKTGEERFLLFFYPQSSMRLKTIREENIFIWKLWNKIERGEPINEEWFKIKVTKEDKGSTTKSIIKK